MGRVHNLNGESDFPLKGYKVGRFTITRRDGQWIAVDNGVVVKSHRDESFIANWAGNQK